MHSQERLVSRSDIYWQMMVGKLEDQLRDYFSRCEGGYKFQMFHILIHIQHSFIQLNGRKVACYSKLGLKLCLVPNNLRKHFNSL